MVKLKRLSSMGEGDNSDSDQNRVVQSFWYDLRNLPDLLLVEILARLPLKSIFRFKIVCKHWKALICHPSFRRFYLSILDSNTNAPSLPFKFLYRYIFVWHFKVILNRLHPEIDYSSEIYNSSENSLLLSISTMQEREAFGHFKVLGMSHGLILCGLLSSAPFDYYVGDPVTQKWITLPKNSARHQLHFGEGIITRVNQEDHMLTGFTVVMVSVPVNTCSLGSLVDSSLDMNYFAVEMYSSESGEWIRYMLPCVKRTRLLKRGGGPIFCYGAFHWLLDDHSMVAFDPHKEPKSIRLIPLPNDSNLQSEHNHDNWLYRFCEQCQGTLCYFEVAQDPTKFYFLKMWSMKDYEKGEWGCEFKVSRMDIHCKDPELSNWLLNGGTFLPLSFHPLNANVVYLRCVQLGWVVSYDLLSRRMDFACKLDACFEDLSWRVVMPFVIPRWPMLMSIASQPPV